MILTRLIQRASILATLTIASIPFYNNPAQAKPQACIVTDNGRTVCGQARAIERMCVTTDGTNNICGKFKSAKEDRRQEPEATRPAQGSDSQVAIGNVAFSIKECRQTETTVICSFSIMNKGADRDISFEPSYARITDPSGRTYIATFIEMGGQNISWTNTMTANSGINYEATFTFKNIPAGVRKAQLLSFPFDNRTVKLRNINFIASN